jgi:hypothetical protein
VDDAVGIIRAKEKWGLDLTNDEKTLKKYIMQMPSTFLVNTSAQTLNKTDD